MDQNAHKYAANRLFNLTALSTRCVACDARGPCVLADIDGLRYVRSRGGGGGGDKLGRILGCGAAFGPPPQRDSGLRREWMGRRGCAEALEPGA